MYHPAAALHQGSLREIIQEDMLRIPQILAQCEKMPEEVNARQLELF
jgi:DNA polymerase